MTDKPRTLDYATSAPTAQPQPRAPRRIVVPRALYNVHRILLGDVSVFSLIYGLLLMAFGWSVKDGVVFVPPSRRRRKEN